VNPDARHDAFVTVSRFGLFDYGFRTYFLLAPFYGALAIAFWVPKFLGPIPPLLAAIVDLAFLPLLALAVIGLLLAAGKRRGLDASCSAP